MKNKSLSHSPAGLRLPRLIYGIWTGVFVWLLVSGRFHDFIQPSFWPLLALGAVLTISFGWLGQTVHPGHMAAGLPRNGWILGMVFIIPLLFLFSAWGNGLGGYALTKRSMDQTLEQPFAQSRPLQATPTPVVAPADYGEATIQFAPQPVNPVVDLYTLRDHSELYAEQKVIAEGMVFRGARTPDQAFVLFRFQVSCCVADAQPLAILVHTTDAATYPNDSWVKVTGVFHLEEGRGLKRYYIEANKVEHIHQPSRQYLYAN